MPLPKTMRAVEISRFGGPEVLRVAERPLPDARDGEILVRVAAAGVNRPDIMQRLGKYPPPPGASDLPGLEIAGMVVRGTSAWPEGARVCALVAGGGYAEYCAVPVEQVLPAPANLTDTEAAAIPETFFTVWTNLFDRAALKAGERVLIHGGTSGIGSTAIQLAAAFGAIPYATAGSAEKCHACERLGAARAINYRTEDFVDVIRTVSAEGVDVVLDIIGGDYFPRNLDVLRLNGRLVQIGLIGGPKATINLTSVLQRRLTITGSTLRARTPTEKGSIAAALRERVWPLLETGRVRPQVDRVIPLASAADAHDLLERGEVIGKVVLQIAAS